MAAFIASFLFVLLAEMGDKTQLLAMAFATRYSAQKVLIAVFLATAINHALAVLVGRFLTTVVPLDVISFIAALSFIIFGLWTIRGDKLEGEDKKASRFGPIITVGIAFFLAEMGDKTQLATIALAVQYRNMLSVLMGTTLAMVAADAVGIGIGIVLKKHIPERTIKWVSASIFALFGFLGVYKSLSARLSVIHTSLAILLIGVFTILAACRLVKLSDKAPLKV
ncbi:MAG: TMEM165/GDT1 family protein [Candidatus Omnitrophica bacterium]|nr:TMEM165/GDT1 family protein [Candidatus Omnitrophota bacterium]